MYDIKLINAKFPDYDNNKLKINDICINNGKIEYIGVNSKGAKLELDVEKYVIAPGFIDIHMHEEELDKYPHLVDIILLKECLEWE